MTAFTNGASSPTQCKVVSTGPSGGDQFVEVFCHSMGGAAVDSMFSASFTSVTTPPGHLPFLPDASFGYLRSPQNLGAVHPHTCVDADPLFDDNSRGGSGTAVCKRDVGVYEVWVRAQVARTGNVQVTAYGAGSARCKAHRWNAASVGHIIGVRCFAATGVPIDSAFTFSHVRDGSILGVELCCHPDGHDSAYAWASQPTATSYDLDPLFQFNRLPHHQATGERLGKGRYTTRYDSDPDLDHGTAIVTAHGRGPEFCNLALWNRTDGIRTNCFDPSGALVDTNYAVAFTGRWQLG